MFFLNRLNNRLFGASNYEVAKICEGSFLYCSGKEETILPQASITLKKTTQEFCYELVIQDDQEDLEQEASFLVDKVLDFNVVGKTLEWIDVENRSSKWKFKANCSQELVDQFQEYMVSCMFEREHKKKYTDASDKELEDFIKQIQVVEKVYFSEQIVPTQDENPFLADSPLKTQEVTLLKALKAQEVTPLKATKAQEVVQGIFNPNVTTPEGSPVLNLQAALSYFDVGTNSFVILLKEVTVEIINPSQFEYHLVIKDTEATKISQEIGGRMNPYTNTNDNTFIWVEYQHDLPKVSWCLTFKNQQEFQAFTGVLFGCVFEAANKSAFADVKDNDMEYITQAINDYEMDVDDPEQSEEEEEDSDEEAVFTEKRSPIKDNSGGYEKGSKNSLLAVGYKHNRSFVVRGNKIGVFKHTDEDDLEFATTINNIGTKDGEFFSPMKMMLHNQDKSMIMMKPGDSQNLHVMDLEYGKVVEEWKVSDYKKVEDIIPDKKYNQQTTDQTLLGLNDRSIFRIDGRLAGNKLAEDYQYKTDTKLSCAATTGQGDVAIGSKRGDIRLFNKVGIKAKTLIPGLGDPIIGMDTTENGKYILATCSQYLMVIDTQPDDGGPSAFKKSYKSKPRRLQLKPEHIAAMGKNVCFTPAKFNTGPGDEKTIVSSSGPFVITWNFRRVKLGKTHDYVIKQYEEDVVADNFKFGQDKNIIVALGGNVEMTSKSQLQTPTKMLKSRSKIVNSPY